MDLNLDTSKMTEGERMIVLALQFLAERVGEVVQQVKIQNGSVRSLCESRIQQQVALDGLQKEQARLATEYQQHVQAQEKRAKDKEKSDEVQTALALAKDAQAHSQVVGLKVLDYAWKILVIAASLYALLGGKLPAATP